MGKYRTAFGDLLDDLLYEKGTKSLTEFGDRVGIAKNALSQYCTGSREPGDEILLKMALDLDVDFMVLKRAAMLDRFPLWQLIVAGVFDSLLSKVQVEELQTLMEEEELEELLKTFHKDLELQKRYISVGWNDFLRSLEMTGFLERKKGKQPEAPPQEGRAKAV